MDPNLTCTLPLKSPAQSIASRCAPWMVVLAIPVFLSGCGTFLTQVKNEEKSSKPSSVSTLFGGKKRGGYYLDDGPEDNPPANLHLIPDAVPRDEPLRPSTMRPYSALGKSYKPMTRHERYKARGMASWYGRRYHGQKTASGEVYDMYAMTAAHPVLPIPSYARVTNITNGKSVVVRVNDRGPFLSNRLIDLSYTAAYKLNVLGGGSGLVEVESIVPGADKVMRVAASAPPRRRGSRSGASRPPSSSNANVTAQSERTADPSQALPMEPENAEARKGLFQVAFAPEALDTPAATQAGDTASDPAPETPAVIPAGVYLQLGAFNAYDNADNFIARMRSELPSLSGSLGIVEKDGLFKVHAGPYPDRAQANQIANKIAEALSVRPMLLVR